MKKIYVSPKTNLVSTLFNEGLMNPGGSVYGKGIGLDSGISGGNGDPVKNEFDDFEGDAKEFTFENNWDDYGDWTASM